MFLEAQSPPIVALPPLPETNSKNYLIYIFTIIFIIIFVYFLRIKFPSPILPWKRDNKSLSDTKELEPKIAPLLKT